MDEDKVIDDDFVFYSLLYSSITVVFAMAVLSKFLKNEFYFGFRSLLSLVILFIGEPVCHVLLKGATGVLLFGTGCLFVYSILPASHLPSAGKSVLITGCDSGFGQALAKKLDAGGMRVFAGCLDKNGPGAMELAKCCSERMQLVQLDVTDEKQVTQAKDDICRQLSDDGLWGLVNNAGIGYMCELEMTPISLFRRVLEVNVVGVVAVTKAFLPLVRRARGRIVNMSSMAGRMPLEWFGAYCVSKSGLETFSDVLHAEMKKWNVKVSIIEPSGFKTVNVSEAVMRRGQCEVWAALDEETRTAYGRPYFDAAYDAFGAARSGFSADLGPVVRAARSALLSTRPRRRYPVGLGAGSVLAAVSLLPAWATDRLLVALSVRPQGVLPAALSE